VSCCLPPRRKPWDGHHDVTACKGGQALNSTLVIALAWAAIAVMNGVMRQEPAEQLGSLAHASRQNLRHQAPVSVIKNRLRHAPKERKGMDMAINLLPGRRCVHRRKDGPQKQLRDKRGQNRHRYGVDPARRNAPFAQRHQSPPWPRQNPLGRGRGHVPAAQTSRGCACYVHGRSS
jgi:hypothetical protein